MSDQEQVHQTVMTELPPVVATPEDHDLAAEADAEIARELGEAQLSLARSVLVQMPDGSIVTKGEVQRERNAGHDVSGPRPHSSN